jgi:serine/threonine protein kinase
MRRLRHNHIVAFVSSFSRGDQFGVLLYPLARCNLAQYLKDISENNPWCKRPDPVHYKTLSAALGCLSSAVMYLHVSQKIKHKDIKPENILLDRYGSVLLADFGISKQYPDKTATRGPTPYTEKYAPPEVVHQDERDLSADIFSLGCVFLEIVTVILGESLKSLNVAIFAHCDSDRHSYSQSIPKVTDWICHLKEVASYENFPIYSSSAGIRPTGDYGYIAGDQPLTERHLDVILSMISKTPEERPSITDLCKLFKSFSRRCPECQGSVSHASHRLCQNETNEE